MSNFSQHTDYSITLNDTIDTITITSDDYSTLTSGTSNTITLNYPGSTYSTTSISGLSTAQINTISSINIGDFTISTPTEFVDCMPEFSRIEKMCSEYPGLKIAFEKFKTTYYLVKDDYDTPKDKRVKP